ncbi:MAG: primosomal protein N' [Rickettsiales bacterium]|jgi:primosomal protein N' (replication factor Y)|nr:primosomal protein N' [Rickettsiales bacterium]
MLVARVLVPRGVHRAFDYDVAGSGAVLGSLVRVPFGGRETFGLVVALGETSPGKTARGELRSIAEVLPVPPLEVKFIKFIEWFADYNVVPPGLALKLVFSEKFIQNGRMVKKYSYLADASKKITKKQEEVVKFLRDNFPRDYGLDELESLCGRKILDNLVKGGILGERRSRELPRNGAAEALEYAIDADRVTLNELSRDQREVFDGIVAELEQNRKPILLEGITGSGKTEIYFHLFRRILEMDDGGQILFMLPEIALTSQFVDRFRSQFGCQRVAVWHSAIGDATRRQLWNAVSGGNLRFVMGARSSLFLPFRDLRLLVVDEEHDVSYSQSDNVSYNARNMAVARAKFDDCPIVLGSATPSLESLFNAESKKYNYFFLKSRFGNSTMPKIKIVDLTKDKLKPNSFLSSCLVDEMDRELSGGRQVLLFMNRRGYAPIALCNNCGYRFSCPNCGLSLAVHGAENAFLCHHCGYRTKKQSDCPACGLLGSIIFFGPGVEKVEAEVRRIFPSRNTMVITSDTARNVEETAKMLQRVVSGEVDILIGSQMITKGYDFPNLTLVGVLDADASLFGANFRSAERTYQLLTQVTGRAGRRMADSRALVQSHSPNNVIVQALERGDRNIILDFERESRKIANLPPYGRITSLLLFGRDESLVQCRLGEIMNILPPSDDSFGVFGPVPLHPPQLAGNFRIRLVFRTKNNFSIKKLIFHILDRVKLGGAVKFKLEVDPHNL